MNRICLVVLVLLAAFSFDLGLHGSDEQLFVSQGKPLQVYEQGKTWRASYKPWKEASGFLEGVGDPDGFHQSKQLIAGRAVGEGDFHVRAILSILKLKGSGASFSINNDSYFVFSGPQDEYYDTVTAALDGPLFGPKRIQLGELPIKEAKPFVFELIRSGGRLRFIVDGREMYAKASDSSAFGAIGFLPWWGTMKIQDFSLEGRSLNLSEYYHRAPEHQTLYESGTEGYVMFKIPALVATQRGSVLAFCEARHWASDSADIEIVMRRSENIGKSWSPHQVIWDDGKNTCGNPCPVEDREAGIVWMLMCRNNREVFAMSSKDDGQSWTKPVEITSSVKRQDWGWYATGPGTGIQMRRGKYKGRLVIPCDHRSADYGMGSHAVYSDDHGRTWNHGQPIIPKVNECQVVELSDGSLMMNLRSYNRMGCRAVAVSKDGGETWSETWHDPELIEPICQASILRADSTGSSVLGPILFSNPAARERIRLTVRLSRDEGRTWPVSRLLYSGPSGYSSLAVLSDGSIGCLFEAGIRHLNENVSFARFPLEWLEGKRDGRPPLD